MTPPLEVGAEVRYWPGWREGPGRLGRVWHGPSEVGGTRGYFVRDTETGSNRGFIAATHVEEVARCPG